MRIRHGVLAAFLVAGLAACDQSETVTGRGTTGDSASVSAGVAAGVGPTDSLDEKTASELARKYVQCAKTAGFEIEHVWVHEFPDTGIMVKTEVDVPASVHGPCLASIGGPSTDGSSWGI